MDNRPENVEVSYQARRFFLFFIKFLAVLNGFRIFVWIPVINELDYRPFSLEFLFLNQRDMAIAAAFYFACALFCISNFWWAYRLWKKNNSRWEKEAGLAFSTACWLTALLFLTFMYYTYQGYYDNYFFKQDAYDFFESTSINVIRELIPEFTPIYINPFLILFCSFMIPLVCGLAILFVIANVSSKKDGIEYCEFYRLSFFSITIENLILFLSTQFVFLPYISRFSPALCYCPVTRINHIAGLLSPLYSGRIKRLRLRLNLLP